MIYFIVLSFIVFIKQPPLSEELIVIINENLNSYCLKDSFF